MVKFYNNYRQCKKCPKHICKDVHRCIDYDVGYGNKYFNSSPLLKGMLWDCSNTKLIISIEPPCIHGHCSSFTVSIRSTKPLRSCDEQFENLEAACSYILNNCESLSLEEYLKYIKLAQTK